jgi:hypothetical protein
VPRDRNALPADRYDMPRGANQVSDGSYVVSTNADAVPCEHLDLSAEPNSVPNLGEPDAVPCNGNPVPRDPNPVPGACDLLPRSRNAMPAE